MESESNVINFSRASHAIREGSINSMKIDYTKARSHQFTKNTDSFVLLRVLMSSWWIPGDINSVQAWSSSFGGCKLEMTEQTGLVSCICRLMLAKKGSDPQMSV